MIDFVYLLKEKELKATPQRLCLLKELSKKEHPTIEQLYEAIRMENPSISLATVYKNLSTLKEKSLVIEVNAPDGKMRYDINQCPHIHLICKECGSIYDRNLDHTLLEYQAILEDRESVKIEKMDLMVTIYGCKMCLH